MKNDQLNQCAFCKFPAGTFYNNKVDPPVRKSVFLYNHKNDTKICNHCMNAGIGMRLKKLDKKERKELKAVMRNRPTL